MCRTYNGFDINFTEEYFEKVLKRTVEAGSIPNNMILSGIQKDGRGNIAPCTIVLPFVAMEAKKKAKENPEYVVDYFMDLLEKYIGDAKDELIERFNWIAAQPASSAKYMYNNNTMKGYEPEEGIRSALIHGTLAIGQLGLAECLTILIGEDQTTEKGMELAKKIESLYNEKCNEYKHNYRKIPVTYPQLLQKMISKATERKGSTLTEEEISQLETFCSKKFNLLTPAEKVSSKIFY